MYDIIRDLVIGGFSALLGIGIGEVRFTRSIQAGVGLRSLRRRIRPGEFAGI